MDDQNTSGNKEEYAKAALEKYVKECKIFIDTCSLLHDSIRQFWLNIIPLLRQYNNRVFVPGRVIEELMKKSALTTDPELAEKAKAVLKLLSQLNQAKMIEIRKEDSDNFADNVFQVVFTKYRLNYRLLLITQDGGLSSDILGLNNSKAVKAYPVTVKKLNQYGFLSNPNIRTDEKPNKDGQKKTYSKETVNENEIFEKCTQVSSIQDNPLRVSYVPVENDVVYTVQGPVKLLEAFAEGGEGTLYNTDSDYVAKIYKREKNTARKYEKIKRLIEKAPECEGVCFPVAALYNQNREFVGYLMEKASGKELQKSLFIKPLLLKHFPTWKKKDTVQLCITILEKIKFLHDRNIIMGDINPANILIVSPTEVYFVDTDSYQIEDLPCPVGTINYTAPEIQGKHYETFLRSFGNENFAVATLLFMIMLPGKPPYSQQGGSDPYSNIKNMDFSYPFGESSNKKTPDGAWRFIWSHLTYDLKKAFYNTFHKGGEHSTESTRLSTNEWLSIFRYYHELLVSGRFAEQDPMSEELFPTRHKKNQNITYITCKLCGVEYPEDQCKSGICPNCLNKGEVYPCKRCGKNITYSNYHKYVKNAKRFDVCSDCFEWGKQVKLRPICCDCGRFFDITNNEYESYSAKGFALPKRCKTCRDTKKNGAPARFTPSYTSVNFNAHYPAEDHSNEKKNDDGSGTFCFITTAVCELLGKSDDCAELNALRAFRDNWLRHTPDGEALIEEYYATAPILVSRMKASDRCDTVCKTLWEKYILPCLCLIEAKDFEACKLHYIRMVGYMNAEFGDGN